MWMESEWGGRSSVRIIRPAFCSFFVVYEMCGIDAMK